MLSERFPSPTPEEAPSGTPNRPGKSKLKKLVSGALIAANMAAGMGMAPERALAEERTGRKTASEREEKLEGTESSAWAPELVARAKVAFANVRDAAAVERWVRTYYKGMVSEFYLPTRGSTEIVRIGDLARRQRRYLKDDARIILQSVGEMRDIMRQLNTRYGVDGYERFDEQLFLMEEKLKQRASQ